MASRTRTLILVRHAQAESLNQSDRDRRLTAEGRLNARSVGDWLCKQQLHPDYVIVSPARRTQETWQEISVDPVPPLGVELDESLYSGDVIDSQFALGGSPTEARTILYLGHNPTISTLALSLVDSADQTGQESFLFDLPPAGVVVMDGIEDLSRIDHGVGRIQSVFVGGSDS